MDKGLGPLLTLIVVVFLLAGVSDSDDDIMTDDEPVRAAEMSVPGHDAASSGLLSIVNAVPGREFDVQIDGVEVTTIDAAGIAGPYVVDAGTSTVVFAASEGSSGGGDVVASAMVDIDEGETYDLLVHLPEDGGDAVTTVFQIDLIAVPADRSMLTFAHAAALSPLDASLDGDVLFSGIANGEYADLVLPAGSFETEIRPAGAKRPIILGPDDVRMDPGTHRRLYVIGDPENDTVGIVSQSFELPEEGSPVPDVVDTGTGGVIDTTDVP